MDAIDNVVDPLREFSRDSIRLVKRCHKPDRKEFTKVAFRTAIGFVVMGFVGCKERGEYELCHGASVRDKIEYCPVSLGGDFVFISDELGSLLMTIW
ncbi:hypothetical protein V2J09_008600 [Rumex salicifolius]